MEGISFCFPWEVQLIEWLQSFAGPLVTAIASFFTMFGEELVLVGILGFTYWCYDKKWAKYIGINLLAALLAGPLIKNIALRRRPYMDHEGIRCLRKVNQSADVMDIAAQGYSFPSMHSANTMTVFQSLARCMKKSWIGVLTAVIILGVGISRMYLGVHYPTDVLAGWLIGALVVAVISRLQVKITNPLVFAAIYGIVGLPGWFYCTSHDFYTVYGLAIGILLGFYVEERWVHFENTKSVIRSILRLVGGVALFLIITTVTKMLFSKEVLEASNFVAHVIRFARYAIGSFVVICIYPILFRYTAKFGRNS